MSEVKPFASLSSGLLARKGAAKPAMRPQGYGHFGGSLEDLGWNDMGPQASAHAGPEPEEHVPSSIAALTPAPQPHDEEADREIQLQGPAEEPQLEEAAEDAPPPVIEQQRAIAATFETPEPAPRQFSAVVPLPRPRAEAGAKGKAAFTLRLDPERHLKLRLACAVTHRSAQQLVTQALDEFLGALPELDSIAEQMPRKIGKRS